VSGKLAFKSTFHVEVVEPDEVYLLSEQGHFGLKGKLYCQLAPLLDGRHDPDEIVEALAGEAGPAEVYYALSRLERRGHLVASDAALPPARAAFWEALGLDAPATERRLRASTVTLAAFGAVPAEPFADALARLGPRIGDDGDVTVVLTDDYLQAGLAERNAAALAAGRPWLLVKPVGTRLWLGPLFRPGRTGCWECLAERLRGQRPIEAYLRHGRPAPERAAPFPVARAALPASVAAALELAATETARALAGAERSPLEGALLTLDLATLETRRHTLVRRPQCPACGDGGAPEARGPAPPVLACRSKPLLAAGSHRTTQPEQILATYEHHVSPITGVVSTLERLPTDDTQLLHVYAAGYRPPPGQATRARLRWLPRAGAMGKGTTDLQARASALCEALECYSTVFQGDEPRRRASYRELGERAIHPDACLQFSEAQYRGRQDWNTRGGVFGQIPEPFDEAAPIDWSPVWSLTAQAVKYVPTACCYFGYPDPLGRFSHWSDSNGHAAGATLEEAVLHGLLELIERDSVTIWWYNRIPRPAVDLDSFEDGWIAALQRHYRQRRRDLWVLDLTGDLGIPVFVALSRRSDRPGAAITLGHGAHLDARIALLRALTEVNQLLAATNDAAPDDAAPNGRDGTDNREAVDDALAGPASSTASPATPAYLVPDVTVPPRTAADYGRLWSDDVLEDVRLCQERVEAQGLEVLVLDHTRPDIGLPVVQVIVPGLRHYRPPRLAPGRLYDVPVKLGWLSAPLAEEALNPDPLFP
jgi:ribosomal protein S12 methylthiotransferase accessory factor